MGTAFDSHLADSIVVSSDSNHTTKPARSPRLLRLRSTGLIPPKIQGIRPFCPASKLRQTQRGGVAPIKRNDEGVEINLCLGGLGNDCGCGGGTTSRRHRTRKS